MTPDNELTLLLPVKDRAPFTVRWMSYANAIRLPFRVLIADGGADDTIERALSDRGGFPHVKYDYIRYPYDRTCSDYYAKVEHALSRVSTPLVALADDDDFFIVDGLREAACFLLDHPDYAACAGQVAGFWVAPGGADANADVTYGRVVEWKGSAETESLEDGTASARLLRKARHTTYETYYHVQRTADLRRHFQLVCRANPRDLFLFGQLLAFLSVIAGKSKQLGLLYLAKQNNSPGSSAAIHLSVAGDWVDRMFVPTWSEDFAKFLDLTSAALARQDGVGRDEARACLLEAYRMEVAPALLANLVDEPTVTLPMCLTAGLAQSLLRRPPEDRLRRMARALYRRIPWISMDAVHGTELRSRQVPHAAESFAPIREFLRQPTC